jgi:hypothetical protein
MSHTKQHRKCFTGPVVNLSTGDIIQKCNIAVPLSSQHVFVLVGVA